MKKIGHPLLLCVFILVFVLGGGPAFGAGVETPAQVWAGYDPDKGDFKEKIVAETTRDGKYYRESYISAYVLGREIRVYCKYKVKVGAKKAPGLLNVHGWCGAPNIDESYVDDGWAVLAHDYCGDNGKRKHFTKYPAALRRGNMDRKLGPPVWSHTADRKSITDARQTSDYVWYAVQSRALSYLLRQKEVDRDRIGAKGYSYGGTIMWPLGTDRRVKAIVAYFGIGWNEYYRSKRVWMYNNPYREPKKSPGEKIYLAGIAPQAYVPQITAATLFLNGTNDHHGGHERGLESFKMFKKGVPWSFAQQARGHHNTEKIGQNARFWLEKHVRGKDVDWPGHPKSRITLGKDGVPRLTVTPADAAKVKKVEMYYALKNACSFARSWRDVRAVRKGDVWIGKMPVLNVDDYVFGFANVNYESTIVRSTDFCAAIPSKLGKAVATDKPTAVIYSGADGLGVWTHVAAVEGPGGVKGFRGTNNNRGSGTEQLSDPKWKAPKGGQLSFKFYCTQPQTLLLRAGDHWEGEIEITAGDDWREMVIDAKTLINVHDKKSTSSWDKMGKIHFRPKKGSDITKVIFAEFKWVVPKAK